MCDVHRKSSLRAPNFVHACGNSPSSPPPVKGMKWQHAPLFGVRKRSCPTGSGVTSPYSDTKER